MLRRRREDERYLDREVPTRSSHQVLFVESRMKEILASINLFQRVAKRNGIHIDRKNFTELQRGPDDQEEFLALLRNSTAAILRDATVANLVTLFTYIRQENPDFVNKLILVSKPNASHDEQMAYLALQSLGAIVFPESLDNFVEISKRLFDISDDIR